ncbi:MAG: hypothetical protein KGD58_08770 [Candidatus Lokiarchaeota archaeon]|nr:hypothetical protein [Candidatus Lokiarchaeota archaeon]
MHKQNKSTKKIKKKNIIGSETTLEKIKRSTPWIFGKKLRKPKIMFPKIRNRKISFPQPSRSLIILAIYVILFLLQTGIVYLIVRDPPSIGVDDWGNPVFVWERSIHEAYINESIVASILMILFSSGFVLVYRASRYVYNKKIAVYYLFFGTLMILITFALLQFMLYVKAPRLVLKSK